MSFFLNLRQRPTGGGVVGQSTDIAITQATFDPASYAVSVLPSNQAGQDPKQLAQLITAILGKNVLLVTHGFNVNQDSGYQCLANWIHLITSGVTAPQAGPGYDNSSQYLDDSWVGIGVLWPGDSSWLGPLCYPGEGQQAMACGNLLAQFIDDNFAGANSISFVSHSLGARFLLQTVTALNKIGSELRIHQVAIMAGAINHDCLTNEYQSATENIDQINLLASLKDEVLAAAFPIGNVFEGIIDSSHPWFQSALGHQGPETIPPGKRVGPYQIPSNWDFGHGSYLELQSASNRIMPMPQTVPLEGTEQPFDPDTCTSAWSAAFVLSRFR